MKAGSGYKPVVLILFLMLSSMLTAQESIDQLRKELTESYSSGNFPKALEKIDAILSVLEQQNGKYNPSYVSALNNKVVILMTLKLFQKADSVVTEALSLIKTIGNLDKKIAASLTLNKARIERFTGRYEEAEKTFLAALALLREADALNHPDYYEALFGLGSLCFEQNKYSRADSIYSLVEKYYEAHPELGVSKYLATKANRAVCLENLGKTDQALKLYGETRQAILKSGITEVQTYIVMTGNFANLLYKTGKTDSCVSVYDELILFLESRSIMNEGYFESLKNYAHLLIGMERDIPFYEKISKYCDFLVSQSADYPELAADYCRLNGVILKNTGDYGKAAAYYAKAVGISANAPKGVKIRHSDLLGEYLNILNLSGDCRTGSTVASELLKLAESMKKSDSIGYSMILPGIADNINICGSMAEAALMYNEAVQILKNSTKGVKNLPVILNNYGNILQNLGRIKDADSVYRAAKKQAETAGDTLAPAYLNILMNLARLDIENSMFVQADSLLNKIELAGGKLGNNSLLLQNLRLSRLKLLLAQSRFAEAKSIIEPELVHAGNGQTAWYNSNINYYAAEYEIAAGNYGKALDALRKSAELYNADLANPDNFTMSLLLKKVLCLTKTGETPEAEKILTTLAENSGKKFGTGSVQYIQSINELGKFYYNTGNLVNAEKYFTLSGEGILSFYSERSLNYSAFLNDIALLELQTGKLAEIESRLSRALSIRLGILGFKDQGYAGILNTRGIYYQKMGRRNDAAVTYSEALDILKNNGLANSANAALFMNNLASVNLETGNPEQAAGLFNESLRIIENTFGKTNLYYAGAVNNLASIYFEKGDYSRASEYLKEAVSVIRSSYGERHPEYCKALNSLALILTEAGNYAEAETLFIRAIELKKEIFGSTHPELFSYYSNFAYHFEKSDKYPLADSLYSVANNLLIEGLKKYLPGLSVEEKSDYLNTIKSGLGRYYIFNIRNLGKKPEGGGSVLDQQILTKASVFSTEQRIRNDVIATGDPGLIKKLDELNVIREKLRRAYASTLDELRKNALNIEQLEKTAMLYQNELLNFIGKSDSQSGIQELNWKALQRSLAPDEALIEIIRVDAGQFSALDSVFYIFVVLTSETQDQPVVIRTSDGKTLETVFVQRYKTSVTKNQPDPEIYRVLLGSVIQRVEGKTKLYISPDGLYNQINLLTLIDESGKYLFDRFSIKLLSNPGNLLRAKKGDFSASQLSNAVLFGYPNYRLNPEIQAELSKNYQAKSKIDFGNLSDADNMSSVKITDLIGTKIEIEQIEKILTGKSISVRKHLQNDALEEAMKVVESPDILHIATHGFFINDKASATQKGEIIRSEKQKRNPLLKSGLLLAGATRGLTGKTPEEYSWLDDGILTAFEAMSLKLDSTKLVVLSACETGLGLAENSDGIAGLQRAFQISGARIIIMSLWKVSDEITKELMTAFYTNMFEAESISAAFRSAQAVIKNKYQNPDYWGAFVLIAY